MRQCIRSRLRRLAYFGSLLAFFLACGRTNCQAQSEGVSNSSSPNAIPVKMFVPAYPRLAQQARIVGDVDLTLEIGRTGHVESVGVVGGPAMLRQVAIESAQNSVFHCLDCDGERISYSLRYRFQIGSLPPDKICNAASEPDPPVEIDLAEHQVTISAWGITICDPAAVLTRVRSAKCLYLWKCGRIETANSQ
jgi:hypothetical protein